MKLWSKVGSVVVVALACAAPLLTAGCGSEFKGDHGQPVEKTGTLQTALSTTGSDGATYTFVTGTVLHLTSGGAFNGAYPFDGPETVFTKTLGVATYDLGLTFGPYPAPVLTRTFNGTTQNVNAIWNDPQPVQFTITNAATTNVVLHFTVPGIADVTFDTGKVSITAQVTKQNNATPGFVVQFGAVIVGDVTNADPAAPYASFFAASTGDVRAYGFGFDPTGPWALVGDTACIPVNVGSISYNSSDPTSSGFNERLLQSGLFGTGTVCVKDGGAEDLVIINMASNGPLPANQQPVLTTPPYTRSIGIVGTIGDVFDGTTLQQTLLEQQVTVTSGTFIHRLLQGTTELTSLTGTLQTGGGFRVDP